MHFSERLAAAVHSLGWTQRRLAEESGVNQTTISNWIARKTKPTWYDVIAVADALGVTLDSLREDARPPGKAGVQEIVANIAVGPVGGPYKVSKEVKIRLR